MFGNAAFLSSPVAADELQAADAQDNSATEASQLQRDLEERAQKDAEAMAADAMMAATTLDLTAHLDLDNGPASRTSLLMASDL